MWCDVLPQEIKNFYDIRHQLMNSINAQATAKTATSAAEVRTTSAPGRRSSLFVVWFSVLFYHFTCGLVVLEVIYFRRWDTPASQALQFAIQCLWRSNQRGVGHFGTKFGEKGGGRCRPVSNAIWATQGAVFCKRNGADIFCHFSTMHERDRQTDHRTVTSIPIGKIAFCAAEDI